MKKEYIIVIIAYLIMQFSGYVGMPLFVFLAEAMNVAADRIPIVAFSYWNIFSFSVALLFVLFILRKDFKSPASLLRNREQAPVQTSVLWAVGGVFLAFFSQSIAYSIETLIGIEEGSDNTAFLVDVITYVPIFVVITAIIGPILEEIVFRKIIFGTLYKKYNFALSAFISSLIFGLAHAEIEHLILYTAMGFTFAFLYVKTNRIIVPIFAHVAMNTTVVAAQLLYRGELEDMMKNAEHLQSIIGGLL
ncbi:MAG: lysostaphin resistance A-like protein [Bacillus sp. (in: firmicutes)]